MRFVGFKRTIFKTPRPTLVQLFLCYKKYLKSQRRINRIELVSRPVHFRSYNPVNDPVKKVRHISKPGLTVQDMVDDFNSKASLGHWKDHDKNNHIDVEYLSKVLKSLHVKLLSEYESKSDDPIQAVKDVSEPENTNKRKKSFYKPDATTEPDLDQDSEWTPSTKKGNAKSRKQQTLNVKKPSHLKTNQSLGRPNKENFAYETAVKKFHEPKKQIEPDNNPVTDVGGDQGNNEVEQENETFITISENIMPVAQDSNVPEELSFNINDLVPFESTITQNSASANVNQSKDPLCTSTFSTRKSSRSTRVPGRFAD